ncbi:LOW QUALITY PROTEIN: replication protein A 70 kDa DNA-binding subunit-like [Aplochiton taeniatus]
MVQFGLLSQFKYLYFVRIASLCTVAAEPTKTHMVFTEAPSTSKGPGRSFVPEKKKTPGMPPPCAPGGSPVKVVPIASLHPYRSKLHLATSPSGIQAIITFMRMCTAVSQKLYIKTAKVYYISSTLKVANKQFCSLNNAYEMSLHGDTSVAPCPEDSPRLPIMQCDFVPIAELENRDKDTVVDVIGVCRSVEEVSRITTRSSREVSKRVVHLMDTTNTEVEVTLWGEERVLTSHSAWSSNCFRTRLKGARVSDFGGRSLSALFSSTLLVNPDMPEAFLLRGWYDLKGHTLNSQSLTKKRTAGGRANMVWKNLIDVQNKHLGQGVQAEYFRCVATVLHSRKESCLYQACPSVNCFKKVVDQQNGLYRCERCDRETPHFKYRLVLAANIADFGANQWVTCFQETAESLLGQSAEALGRLRDTDEEAFEEVFQKANLQTLVFRNRIKLETYNDESRVKATVLDIQPVDHREYSRRLIDNIRKMAA